MNEFDRDPFIDALKWRLRAELNRVRPPHSSPRYAAPYRLGTWRFAPVGLVAGVIGMLGLSAFAATGSPNPVVWSQRIVTVIEPAAAPSVSPAGVDGPAPSPRAAAAAPALHTDHDSTPQPSEGPDQSPHPEPSESPEPSGGGGFGDGGTDDHAFASPSPSSSPGDH